MTMSPPSSRSGTVARRPLRANGHASAFEPDDPQRRSAFDVITQDGEVHLGDAFSSLDPSACAPGRLLGIEGHPYAFEIERESLDQTGNRATVVRPNSAEAHPKFCWAGGRSGKPCCAAMLYARRDSPEGWAWRDGARNSLGSRRSIEEIL